jgi:hypothetical protein
VASTLEFGMYCCLVLNGTVLLRTANGEFGKEFSWDVVYNGGSRTTGFRQHEKRESKDVRCDGIVTTFILINKSDETKDDSRPFSVSPHPEES